MQFLFLPHIFLYLRIIIIFVTVIIYDEEYKLIFPQYAACAMFSFFDLKRRLFQYLPTRSVYKLYDCSTLSKHRHSRSVKSTGMSKPCRLTNVG